MSKFPELATEIDRQLPFLFSFVFLRCFFVWVARSCFAHKFVPKWLKSTLSSVLKILCKIRQLLLATSIAVALALHIRRPPTTVCEPYADQRAQGANTIVALVLILTQNNSISSFLAVSALKAVAEASSAGLLISCCAAAHTTELFSLHTVGFVALLLRATFCSQSFHTQSGVLLALSFVALRFLFLQVLGVFARLLALGGGGAPPRPTLTWAEPKSPRPGRGSAPPNTPLADLGVSPSHPDLGEAQVPLADLGVSPSQVAQVQVADDADRVVESQNIRISRLARAVHAALDEFPCLRAKSQHSVLKPKNDQRKQE